MITKISNICARLPWLVFLIVIGLTGLSLNLIKKNMYFEGDISIFLPNDLPTVKADDYSNKNYNYQESMLIGIEAKSGNIMEPSKLRTIEKIVLGLKELKGTKTFESKLTGKTETLKMSIQMDTEDISSIANLEDAIMDKVTGAVNTGSVIEKLKKDFNIPFKEADSELLPASDADLLKIIPGLQKRVQQDRTFNGSVLSEDLKSASISIPMTRKWDIKKSYLKRELTTGMNPEKLKKRFQGKNTFFAFNVYGKTYDGTTYDDKFIQKHSAKLAEETRDWLNDKLAGAFDSDPEIKKLLTGKFTSEKFDQLYKKLEAKNFFMNPKLLTWKTFTNSFYDFMLDQVDPLSKENLEFKLFDVKGIYNLAINYNLVYDLLEKSKTPEIKTYTAGSPVVFALLSYMMGEDMGRMLPLAIIVVLVILAISFRSARGVLIPLITVVISVIWAIGTMAFCKIPMSLTTSMLPIVLLAIGAAYGIHLINRYYEDVATSKDRKTVINNTVDHVGTAVVMAAITTIAGFSSLAFSRLDAIAHFGIFSAIGVTYALILSLTLTPAFLVLWRLPKKVKVNEESEELAENANIVEKFLHNSAVKVLANPKIILISLVSIFILGTIAATQNEFEGNTMVNFKEDNTIMQSDIFLNKNLTGTNLFNFVFTFRDQIDLKNPEIKKELQQRINSFTSIWEKFASESEESVLTQLGYKLDKSALNPDKNETELLKQIKLYNDIFNEDYTVETAEDESTQIAEESEAEELGDTDELGGSDELDDNADELAGSDELDDNGDELSDDESEEESANNNQLFADLEAEQVAGLKEISLRLKNEESAWEKTALEIVNLRNRMATKEGILLRKKFNLLQDLFQVDVKQPVVLHKLEELYAFMKAMDQPQITIEEKEYKPTGFMVTPVDLVRKFYKVFYHDDNQAYDRLPNADKDGFADTALTDRSLIGVALNQAQNSDRDNFEAVISPDGKEFKVLLIIRNGDTKVVDAFSAIALKKMREIFPENDAYIKSIRIGGSAPTTAEVASLIASSQGESIATSFVMVLCVTFFIFSSLIGGLYTLIPLLFTVVLNFGMIYIMGMPITAATMMVASIAIGTGIDYTIHFLERYKLQMRKGDTYEQAYLHTIHSTGKAILLNALSVAFGFLVLVFSEFIPNITMGILMAGTMFFSSVGALILLPAVILITKPKFIYGRQKKTKKLEKAA